MSGAVGTLNTFRGTLVGALVGDCLGSFYEGTDRVIPWVDVVDYTSNQIKNNTEPLAYTDDSAMTRAICRSLIQQQKYNNRDMAKEFVEEYFRDPNRGYGAAVGTVFQRLKNEKPEDVTQPARLQFDGWGSYGNGAAMRISPLALFSCSSLEVQEHAHQNALITHAHIKGVNGAILQAEAVFRALALEPPNLDQDKFVDDLVKVANDLEKDNPACSHNKEDNAKETSDINPSSPIAVKQFSYADKIKEMKELLRRGAELTQETVVDTFGNGIRAEEAVPAAIFSFLHKGGISFEESIHYAISLGGDTDTIGSMTGAISGAFWGFDKIPELWREKCEGVNEAIEYANSLYELREQRKTFVGD